MVVVVVKSVSVSVSVSVAATQRSICDQRKFYEMKTWHGECCNGLADEGEGGYLDRWLGSRAEKGTSTVVHSSELSGTSNEYALDVHGEVASTHVARETCYHGV